MASDTVGLGLDLSICILTHNRPKLFERCLQSVIRVAPNSEIIVNCDSDDVKADNRARYFYNKDSLNNLYEFLVEQAQGTHIWFMEDDDIALNAPTMGDKMTIHRYISSKNIPISAGLNHKDFQLSQCCVPKHLLDFSCIEQQCNCIFNDYHLLKNIPSMFIPNIIFKQTYNGDNISFPESPSYRGNDCCNCKWIPEALISSQFYHTITHNSSEGR